MCVALAQDVQSDYKLCRIQQLLNLPVFFYKVLECFHHQMGDNHIIRHTVKCPYSKCPPIEYKIQGHSTGTQYNLDLF